MMMDDDLRTLHLVLASAVPEEPTEIDRLTRALRSELTLLDVESLGGGMSIRPPDSAKSADPEMIDAIVVAVSATGGLLVTLIATVRSWQARQHDRHRVTITLDGDTLELDAATAGQQGELVTAFVRRHGTD